MKEEFKKTPVVGREQMYEFMYNDVLTEISRHPEQHWVEGQPAGRGNGSPLGFEHLKAYSWLFDANTRGPLVHGPAHGFVIFPAVVLVQSSVVRLWCFHVRSRLNNLVVIAVNCTIFCIPNEMRR